ncbi:MAG: ABC transporter substrate-binding protein [Armatimonadota bacterium]
MIISTPTRLIIRSLIILAVISFIASTSFATKYPITIKDGRGKTITIQREPKRIVSLTPNNTEILFAIGAGSKIVGVNSWSDYPAAAKKKPSIGDRVINVEKVISLKPDLVVAHGFLNGEAVRSLEAYKMKVYVIDPKTIKQLASDIKTTGKLLNCESKANNIANTLIKVRTDILNKSKSYKSKPKVLFTVQSDPLWAAGPKTFVDEMITIAGGRNLASDIKPGFNQFSTEMAVSRNPDVIIITFRGDKHLFTGGQWGVTNAAKKHRVYEINPDITVRPGPRLINGMREIAKMVHPDANR